MKKKQSISSWLQNEVNMNRAMSVVCDSGDTNPFSPRLPIPAINVFRARLAREHNECFYCVFFDEKGRYVGVKKISEGTLNQCIVFFRRVVKEALDVNAHFLVYVHNHPSGNKKPSSEDEEITRNHKKILKDYGLKLVDHIIVTTGGHFSFLEEGF